MIFKDTYEDLTAERLEEIIDAFAAGKGSEITVGPQNNRKSSEPISGLTSLIDNEEKTSLKSSKKKDKEGLDV